MSVVAVNLPAAAHAEDCLAAPNSAAREGTRWYYRLDRATQHKCWYMRAPDQLTQQVAAVAKTSVPAPAFAIPIPRPRPSPPTSADAGSGGGCHLPLAKLLRHPNTAPPVNASTAETTPSIPKESASQQASTSSDTSEPNDTPLLGVATDETTSAISEMHRAAPPPQTDAEATTSAPDVETSVGATMGETTSSSTTDIAAPKREATSERNAKVAAYGPTAAPEVIAPIDDAASSSIPKDVASQPSTSSDLRSDVAGPASDVSVAKSHAPMPHPIPSNAPADLMSDDWQQTSPSYEIIGNAGAHARTLYLFLRSWWS